MLMGGAALDAVGVPLPGETLAAAHSDAFLKLEISFLLCFSSSAFHIPIDASTLKKEVAEGVDIMVVRELTGGIYFGKPRGFGTNDKGEETGLFQFLRLIVLHVLHLRLLGREEGNYALWTKRMCLRKRVTEIASEFPDVELSHMYVDNASMQLVRNPKQFDTIATNNIFGDILSDEASMITGSIGMLPSASVGESGPGLFEPIHGSAPDIAGQDKANPLATILSAAMLLKYGLGAENAAKRIETAVTETLDNGFRTGDIYSPGTTLVGCKRMGEEVLKALESQK
ncbi:hypothetical protein ZWY2020_031149 [Hordeum vulgare]|nr:hypothetical protein ZWY2020_031149 [Hordeum vulgare]